MIRLTNFMYRSAIDMEGNLVRSDTHEIRCRGWKAVPRDEWRFARQRRSLSELISYYYGAPGKPVACVTCGSKELVLARPPQCATCWKKASASETLKRLPVIPADPAISEALAITEEAFSPPPHEPSARCVDTCNNPLECKEDWDRWQEGLSNAPKCEWYIKKLWRNCRFDAVPGCRVCRRHMEAKASWT